MPTKLASAPPLVVAIIDRRTIDATNLSSPERNARQREWISKVHSAAANALSKVTVISMKNFYGLTGDNDITKSPNTIDTIVYHHLGLGFITVEDSADEQDILDILAPAKEAESGCFVKFLLPRYDKPSWRQLQSCLVALRDMVKGGDSFEDAADEIFRGLSAVKNRQRALTHLCVWGNEDVPAHPAAAKAVRTAKAHTTKKAKEPMKHKTSTSTDQETKAGDHDNNGARPPEHVAAMHNEIDQLKRQLRERDRQVEELNEAVEALTAEVVENGALLDNVSKFLTDREVHDA